MHRSQFIFIPILCLVISCHNTNDSFVSICKTDTTIIVDYLDSKGIYDIKEQLHSDTMILEFIVSYAANQKSISINLPEQINYIKYGDTIKEVKTIHYCSERHSDDKSNKYLDKLK